MKIGIVVDGAAESQALRNLTRRIVIDDVQIIDPIYADMQPMGSAERIVAVASGRIDVLLTTRRVDKAILLIDRERRQENPGQWASTLNSIFLNRGYDNVKVVVKNRKLENWLIADIEVFKRSRARYNVTRKFESAVVPDRADTVDDAEVLLNTIVKGNSYHKRRDASIIAESQNCLTVASNSRSFRVFMRLLGHPSYSNQSRRPAN